jgi:NADPH:quinone reductase-like Zn-dependent oxidoreductase
VRMSGTRAPEVTSPILAQLAALFESGDLDPQVGETFPLAEAARAHAASDTGHGRGRIVLHILTWPARRYIRGQHVYVDLMSR